MPGLRELRKQGTSGRFHQKSQNENCRNNDWVTFGYDYIITDSNYLWKRIADETNNPMFLPGYVAFGGRAYRTVSGREQ
jgi:hypothetical protein